MEKDKIMDTYVDERDYKLLDADKYTFFILKRIMGGDSELLLSDHENLILCFTGHPNPVWIWTPEDASEEELEKAYQLAEKNGLLSGEYHFNVKYALAEYFVKRAAEDGLKMKITMNMLAYDCLNPIKPEFQADGEIYRCESTDLDELADFLEKFLEETGVNGNDIGDCRKDAEDYINSGNMYFWKDEQGNNAASCKWAQTGDMASINLVFTRPEFRRKHYAENLVYQVTMKVKEAGCIPMLYTDADYAASNACYEKIGYVLRGKLCTIG